MFRNFLNFFSVDCWDGGDGEPIIYHGYTLTSRIVFSDVLLACKDYAFHSSDYPLILSIENHCSLQQQDRMAELLTSIVGDLLYKQEDNLTTLPSPEALKGKILIKGKKAAPTIEEDDEDGDGADEANKNSKDVSQKLSDLGTDGTNKTKITIIFFFSKSPSSPL